MPWITPEVIQCRIAAARTTPSWAMFMPEGPLYILIGSTGLQVSGCGQARRKVPTELA
ncbi:hypothetical protein GPY37_14155 [Photorhabdus kayaii]|uniref:Uncharacterized protein n=1 Tax=Photorhabdus kayaii TaxID=230088 RepID=A0ABX0B4J8_9GAMM|nr:MULTISPECIES: hypothetical protein [Photorhabdus]MCC8372652.1 hypothetical protein [Photorhabdus bodei]NDL12817.1 hypothetical protein [Photorhabdus kayaii]NDL26599.1 hypothetical protein [Photorhabdus kayaii]